MKRFLTLIFTAIAVLGLQSVAFGAEASSQPVIDSGNTAWMLVSTALVLLMTIPGLAFFYGGLVRQKNVLNILVQCIVMTAVITLQWVIVGYSLSFGTGNSFIGGFDWAFLRGITPHDVNPFWISQEHARIPHFVFIMYQCMFAVITPALIIGAFAERIKFSGFLLFSVLWATLVYDPICHWLWSPEGWLYKLGAVDFAGGIVVHVNAGVAAIVTAVMIGRRKHYNDQALPPHNIPFVVLGTGLLWFGWFGFNAGSGLAADGLAANAFLTTQVSAAAAAVVWMILDYVYNKKPTVVGIATAAVGGLAAVTPAAGFVGIAGALSIGIVVAVVCFYMVGHVKPRFRYDDTLDAFGVHGVGGVIGSLAVGVFATNTVQSNYSGIIEGNFSLLGAQSIAVLATLVYSGVLTWGLFKLTDKLVGIRVDSKHESIGLDLAMHNEVAYTYID